MNCQTCQIYADKFGFYKEKVKRRKEKVIVLNKFPL
jgi:hypothetical protein